MRIQKRGVTDYFTASGIEIRRASMKAEIEM